MIPNNIKLVVGMRVERDHTNRYSGVIKHIFQLRGSHYNLVSIKLDPRFRLAGCNRLLKLSETFVQENFNLCGSTLLALEANNTQ